MNVVKKRYLFNLIVILGLACLTWLSWAATPTPSQAGPQLPPRETPTPRPPKDHHRKDKDNSPSKSIGAYIALQLQGAPETSWAVVQWQDGPGNWHDVEGWQGPVNGGGTGPFGVASKDFGTGPFRWAILDSRGGTLLKGSDSFHLPRNKQEYVVITLNLGQ